MHMVINGAIVYATGNNFSQLKHTLQNAIRHNFLIINEGILF